MAAATAAAVRKDVPWRKGSVVANADVEGAEDWCAAVDAAAQAARKPKLEDELRLTCLSGLYEALCAVHERNLFNEVAILDAPRQKLVAVHFVLVCAQRDVLDRKKACFLKDVLTSGSKEWARAYSDHSSKCVYCKRVKEGVPWRTKEKKMEGAEEEAGVGVPEQEVEALEVDDEELAGVELTKSKLIVQRCGRCPPIPFVLELVPCCYLLYYALLWYRLKVQSQVKLPFLALGFALVVPYPLFEILFCAMRSWCLRRMMVGSYSVRVPQASCGPLGLLWWPTRRVLFDPPPIPTSGSPTDGVADDGGVTRVCGSFGRWYLGPRAATATVAESQVPPDGSAPGANADNDAKPLMPLTGSHRFFPTLDGGRVFFCPSFRGDHVFFSPSFGRDGALLSPSLDDDDGTLVSPSFDGDHVLVSSEHAYSGGCSSASRPPVWAKRGCCAAAPLRKLLLFLGSLGLVLLFFTGFPQPKAEVVEEKRQLLGATQVAFLLDTSGSMKNFIVGVRSQLMTLHNELQKLGGGLYQALFATFAQDPKRREEEAFRSLNAGDACGMTATLKALRFALKEMFPTVDGRDDTPPAAREPQPQPEDSPAPNPKRALFLFTDGVADDYKDTDELSGLLEQLHTRDIFFFVVRARPGKYKLSTRFFLQLEEALSPEDYPGAIVDVIMTTDNRFLDSALEHFTTKVTVAPPEPDKDPRASPPSPLPLLLSVLPLGLWWMVLNCCCWPREAEMDKG